MSPRQGSAAGGPATEEIEVTPAMIAAGVSAYCRVSSSYNCDEEWWVEKIYRAMQAARWQGRQVSQSKEIKMSFIERELNRIEIALRQSQSGNRYAELYAAQQALAWATDPNNFASPFDTVTDSAVEPKDCSAQPHQPLS